MSNHDSDWTTSLLQAINRAQTAYIQHQTSFLTLNLLLDALLDLTEADYGFIGEFTNQDGVEHVRFYHKGDTPWRRHRRSRHAAPVEVHHLVQREDSLLAELLTARDPILHNGLTDRPNRLFVPDRVPAITAFLGIPLQLDDRRLGLIGLSKSRTNFDARLIESLQPLITTATNVLDARHQQRRRRRAERNLSAGENLRDSILETAADGVIACDQLDRILEFNPAAEKMLGWKKSEIIGRQVVETIVPPKFIDEYRNTRRRSVEKGRFVLAGTQLETQLLRKDGSLVSVGVSVSETEMDGRPVATAIIRDMTAQIEAVERYQTALRDLENANLAKRKFVATMSHEIRTPLNVIRGGLSLLDEKNLDRGSRELLRTIRDSSNILLSLVNDVLDFAKIESGEQEPVETQFNPVDLVDSTIRVMSVRAFRSEAHLCFFVDPHAPAAIKTDKGRLHQVLINLVGNAIKYNPSGHVEIRLMLEDPQALRFEVEDDGPGIANLEQTDLFAEFSQAHDSTVNQHDGAGLGLAISKRLIELMGGDIGVDSAPGRGSTFWFTLPIHCNFGGQLAACGEFSGLTALIIGADKPWRRAIERQLRAWHIDVDCATEDELDASWVGQISKHSAYHLIFLPAISSHESSISRVISALQAHGAKLIALAPSFGLVADGGGTPSSEVDAVIPIPITYSGLVETVSRVTGRRLSNGISGQGLANDAELAATEPKTAARAAQSLRVLLAEDGQANRMVGEALLRQLGHSVDSVANGAEAVDAVQSFPYDVVLMDLSMPEMDGFEAARRIRQLPGKKGSIPIIAITAHVLDGTRDDCINAGMNEYLTKPIDSQEMLRVIDRLTIRRTDEPDMQSTSDLQIESIYLERIDQKAIMQLANDTSNDMVNALVDAFIREITSKSDIISDAIAEQELSTLARESHILKSTAGTFGATQVCTLAADLNKACKANRQSVAVGLAHRLVAEIELSKQAYKDTFDLGVS